MHTLAMPDVDYAAHVAAAIKAAAYYRELDPEKIAARMGVHVETVRRWMRGQNLPTAEDFAQLAEVLDAPGDLFMRPPASRDRALAMMATWDAMREGGPRL